MKVPEDFTSSSEYVCSVLSTVLRLHPFDFLPSVNNYEYLRLKVDMNEPQNIMFFRDKNITIIPLIDTRRQLIVIPMSQIKSEPKLSKLSLCQQVRSLMK